MEFQSFSHLVLFIIVSSTCETFVSANDDSVLLVISFDAFKPDYIREDYMIFLKDFYNSGVLANNMINCFPTKTFTNHFSIATGQYPASHGVTGNDVYDLNLGLLKYQRELFQYDKNITPIWTLNELEGGRSGVMMWPGSDFKYKNTFPTYFESLDKGLPLQNRTDKIISWITDPIKPANFVMWYIEDPDEIGHAHSPDSKQMREKLRQLDDFVFELVQRLAFEELDHRIDIIILSDHGMTTVTPANFLNLFAYVDEDDCSMYGSSPVLQVVCKSGRHNEACHNLTISAEKYGNFKAYINDKLPERWRVKNEQRFGPCTVVAEPGYGFQDMFEYATWFKDNHDVELSMNTKYGIHGYDNNVESMRPIFMAKGPRFKSGVVVNDEFDNVDLFSFFCRLLSIKPIRTDGIDRTEIWNAMMN